MTSLRAGRHKVGKYIAFIGITILLILGLALSFTTMRGESSDSSQCGFKPIHGVWYIGWDRGSYGSRLVKQGLSKIKNELCANYISLQANVYQAGKYSSDPRIDYRTVDDETLAGIVKRVHDLGMKVVLLTPLRPDDGTWEGAVQPRNLSVWFDHWEQILIHYAKFSEEYEVEVLLLGSELPTLRDVPERWKDIVKRIRQYYSGKLSFSVNFWSQRSQFREVLNMTQWEDLDYIGITGYFELTPRTEPSVNQLRRAWRSDLHGQDVLDDLKRIRDRYDKPVVFWEIGYQSKDGTNTYPWDYLRKGGKDEKEQRDSWLGFLEATREIEWFHGFMVFAEQVGLPEDKPGYHGYNVLGKKAEKVFCVECQ